MNQPESLPVTEDVAADLDKDGPRKRAYQRGLKVLAMLDDELTPVTAPWLTENWAEDVFERAYQEFDSALQRWRDLYRATAEAIELNFRIENNPAAGERERREAQQRHNEARKQRDLLLAGKSAFNSDFYTYRYLASQGFLPGYNFPRLPLLAYLPARRGRIGRESFLSRPRFLALVEFGPYSLIYHEGSQYRVTRALLTISGQDQVGEGARLPTAVARLCPVCGYGHFRFQRDADRCVSCGADLSGAKEVKNLYRIENVATKRAERITANEEERVRQGYDMQTTLQFAEADDRLQMVKNVVEDEQGPLLDMQYGPAATVWRMNFGWRRRKEKAVQGFMMNPVTGHWVGGVDEDNGDSAPEGDAPPDRTPPQRIVPYVEDRRNILIVRPHQRLGELSAKTLTTLQYALKRGIESVYQLEESELMAEPLPTRDNRQSILLFEAAEGGAGVLTRLATEPAALAAVASKALEVMHFLPPSGSQPWTRDALKEESDPDGVPLCEAGCYRCLLSYYNQPDHTLVDRKDKEAGGLLLDILCRMTQARSRQGTQGRAPEEHDVQLARTVGSTLEKAWLAYVAQGHRKPDHGQHVIAGAGVCADFFYEDLNLAVFIDGPDHQTEARRQQDVGIDRRLDDLGDLVVASQGESCLARDLQGARRPLRGEPMRPASRIFRWTAGCKSRAPSYLCGCASAITAWSRTHWHRAALIVYRVHRLRAPAEQSLRLQRDACALERPGAAAVATEKRCCSQAKGSAGALPTSFSRPFGPVSFLYEVSDTEGEPLPGEQANPFVAHGKLDEIEWGKVLKLHREKNNCGSRSATSARCWLATRGACRRCRRCSGIRRARVAGPAQRQSRPSHRFATLSTSWVTSSVATADHMSRELAGSSEIAYPVRETEAEAVAYLVCSRRE